jgi:multisubunit Na+/H+ antiporter MnhB subunit
MTLNPVKLVGRLTDAIVYPFRMLFVVGLCFFINWVTSPGVWWVQWVVFGMTIGLMVTWYRAAKALVAVVGIAAIGYFVYRWWKNRQTMPTQTAIETALVETRGASAGSRANSIKIV